jgi:lysyl-tRNA synthetase class II
MSAGGALATHAARLHANSPRGTWNAARDLLDSAQHLFPPHLDRTPAEAVQVMAGIARLLEHAPVSAVQLYAYRAEACLPESLLPSSESGPAEEDVLLLSLAAATPPGAQPWPLGEIDHDALSEATTALIGPIACRTTVLRACAIRFLLRRLPSLAHGRRAYVLRRIVWLTDPRTESPRELLITLTGLSDPLAPTLKTVDRAAARQVLDDFPLKDWGRAGACDERLCLGGRVANVRRHSKVTFADLVWGQQSIQLCLQSEPGLRLSPGDLIVVDGRVGVTRSGRSALFVEHIEGHFAGAAPQQPTSLNRTGVLSAVRRYLQDAGFAEAATPILSDGFRGGAARPFTTWAQAAERHQYLRVTTEPALLELIASGITRCYEIGPSFRNEGLRGQAVKEFTMLEAYAADLDRSSMLEHVAHLITAAYPEAPPLRHAAFDDAFLHISGTDPHNASAVRALATAQIPEFATRTDDRDLLARRLWRNQLRSQLSGLVAITNIPGPSSPLIEGEGRAAARTWIYLHGVEIAEISRNERRSDSLAKTFAQQFARDPHPVHREYQQIIDTFEAGLPPVVGVGLGLTRLAHVIDLHRTHRN